MTQGTTSKAARPQIKPAAIRRFHGRLHAWYEIHGRHALPWRTTSDAYRIWLSEVMLQQTQVSTVLGRFYEPFLQKFPTVEALAAAPRDAVMKAWEGLGYYRRAGNLHEAAKQVVAGSQRGRTATVQPALPVKGRSNPPAVQTPRWIASPSARNDATERIAFPNTVEGLLDLPGIGKNTAHAVAAFAYHHPVAILEANVKRIVARIFALETPSDTELWAGAEILLNRAEPFHYNQAMMDLGSLVCTPQQPACPDCPANLICRGQQAPERYPRKKIKKIIPTREVLIQVKEDAAGRLFLQQREAALLGGLYGFPQRELSRGSNRCVAEGESRSGGVSDEVTKGRRAFSSIGMVTHTYSHFKLIGQVTFERIARRMNARDWHSRAEIAALPLSTLDLKVLALVENCHSGEKKPGKAHRRHQAH